MCLMSGAHRSFAIWQWASKVEHGRPLTDSCCDIALPAALAEVVIAQTGIHPLHWELIKTDWAGFLQTERFCSDGHTELILA